MKRLTLNRVLLGLWLTFVVVAVVPGRSFRAHPHWERIRWVPFELGVQAGDIARKMTAASAASRFSSTSGWAQG